jgi:hypothetical protein
MLSCLSQACQSALGAAEFYEHSKTESWNTTIIVRLPPSTPWSSKARNTIIDTGYPQNSILRSLISESSPPGGGAPSYKYAVNSTIIQHLVPTSALNRAKATQESSSAKPNTSDATISTSEAKTEAVGSDGKPHVGRRGMHSATGAYWNEKTDGMWSFKYEGGESQGLDVVISVIWISI